MSDETRPDRELRVAWYRSDLDGIESVRLVDREGRTVAEGYIVPAPHPQGGTQALHPSLAEMHEFAKQYVLAVAALAKVRGHGSSTTLAYLIEQGYLVPADPRRA